MILFLVFTFVFSIFLRWIIKTFKRDKKHFSNFVHFSIIGCFVSGMQVWDKTLFLEMSVNYFFWCTVKPVYNGHPWDLKKAAVWQRCLIKLRFRLAVDDSNWPLLTGGRCSQVVVKSGLTVLFKLEFISDFCFPLKYTGFYHGNIFLFCYPSELKKCCWNNKI